MRGCIGIGKLYAAAALAVVLAVGLLAPAGAQASWVFKETLGEGAAGGAPEFTKPIPLAVDQATGDLLIGDAEANTISRWKLSGEPDPFSGLSGSNVIEGVTFGSTNSRVLQIAVDSSCALHNPPLSAVTTPTCAEFDPADGNIYVILFGTKSVKVFGADGHPLGEISSSSEGAFEKVDGVGVDSAGAVWIADRFQEKIYKFVATSNSPYTTTNPFHFPYAKAGPIASGAGPTGGFLFAQHFNGALEKIDAGTGASAYKVSEGGITVAVNPSNGRVFSPTDSAIREYDASGATAPTETVSEFAPNTPSSLVQGIAVGGGLLYLANSVSKSIEVWEEQGVLPEVVTKPVATSVGVETATLNGTVNPKANAVTECFFEYGESAPAYGQTVPCAEYEEGGNWHPLSSPAQLGTGSSPVPVRSEVTELQGGTEYHFQLRAANANNASGESVAGGDQSFTTLGPRIGEESVTQITGTSARVGAEIDPNGSPTSFFVEYLDEAEYLANPSGERFNGAARVPFPVRQLPGGTVPQPVFQQLDGLEELTTYHFRFVADNGSLTYGADKSFTTFPPPGPPLSDGRSYEMVSPTHKAGEVIPPEPASLLGGSCLECLPGNNQWTMPMQAGPDGTSVLFSGQPFSAGLASGVNEYVFDRDEATGWGGASLSTPTMSGRWEAFSADLSRGVLWQEDPPLSPLAPVRGGHAFANLYLRDAGGGLTPLITAEPPHRGVGGLNPNRLIVRFAGANTGPTGAFEHVAFEANDSLTGATGAAPAAPAVSGGELECSFQGNCNLYEWSGGQLHLVNVLPGNSLAAGAAVIGSGHLLAGAPATYESANVSNAISADGSRIFWSSEETGHVYVRVDAQRTLEVEGPPTCQESEPLASRACFLTASANGSKVLLSDGQIYALDEGAGAYLSVADLTADEGGAHQGGFEGILGANPDLTRVYFVDTAALSGANGEGGSPQAGGDNLYLWEAGEPTTFIGTLKHEDNSFSVQGRLGTWKANPATRTAQTSDNGGYLAFMSKAPLTGYDNRVRGGGKCDERITNSEECFEVFEYSAASHSLTCVSCSPSGQRPLGQSNLSLLRSQGFEPSHNQPGNLSRGGGGRLFFESQDVLLPQDSNGTIQDVYEWEPQGVGSCARAGGCLGLISTGHAAGDSMFLDSTPSGDDAFFITRQQLLPRDQDDQLDLYDARVGEGFEEGSAGSCAGEGCRGPLAEGPAQPGAASQALTGPGNPKPAKHHKKKHKKHKKHKKKQHSKRAAARGQGGLK